MHRIPWILAGFLLPRLPFVEAAASLSAAPVAVLPPLGVSDFVWGYIALKSTPKNPGCQHPPLDTTGQ